MSTALCNTASVAHAGTGSLSVESEQRKDAEYRQT